MKYDFEICKGCGFKKPIINKKYVLCLKCNRDRLNTLSMDEEVSTGSFKSTSVKKGTKYPKRTNIAQRSEKMETGLEKYYKVRAKKRQDMIDGKYFNCFFTGIKLDPDGQEDFHHADGREGEKLYEYRNIFPAINKHHREYHDLSVEQLMKTFWYREFLVRLKKINHKVYNKELNRLLKAGVLDMESFLKEFK